MSDQYSPNAMGWKIDRIRHQYPDVRRALKGAGSRKAQLERLRTMENMAEVLEATGLSAPIVDSETPTDTSPPRVEAETQPPVAAFSDAPDAETDGPRKVKGGVTTPARSTTIYLTTDDLIARVDRIRKLKKMTHSDIYKVGVDAIEHGGVMPGQTLQTKVVTVVEPKHAEVVRKLGEEQARFHAPSIDDALNRLISSARASELRAQRILEKDAQIERLRTEIEQLQERSETRGTERQAVSPTESFVQVDDSTAQGVLFNFISAFTGTKAVASTSGKVNIEIPGKQARALFDAWTAACDVLGINTED